MSSSGLAALGEKEKKKLVWSNFSIWLSLQVIVHHKLDK